MTTTLERTQKLLAGVDWSRFTVSKAGRIRTKDTEWCPLQVWHGREDGYLTTMGTQLGSYHLAYDIMAAADYDGRVDNRRAANYGTSRDIRKWMLAQIRKART
jgi:hypothetical protein